MKYINLSSFNTSNAETMGSVFRYCQNLLSIDLSNFDTSKVTDMSYMFYDCEQLKSLMLCINNPTAK